MVSSLSITNTFPTLSNVDLGVLEGVFTDLEIKEAVFWIGPLNAPRPDGLQPIFFHSLWDIISRSVCDLVKEVYDHPEKISDLNETLVVLIPKVANPESLMQFRPIILCNVIYKIVSKIVATRLK